MSVMDKISKLLGSAPEGETIEVPLTVDEVVTLGNDTRHWLDIFTEEYERTCRGRASRQTYETIKRYLEYKHPSGRPLSRVEIANEVGMEPGSIARYIRLYVFEAAWLAASDQESFIVLLADGSGNLLLKPEHREVLQHHARLEKTITSMQATMGARHYASLVAREGA